MWLILAFVSATFLGFYDTSKKAALKGNAVLPVLLLNTIFSTLIFSPFLIDYLSGGDWFAGTLLDTTPSGTGDRSTTLHAHLLVILKAFIVLSSWIFGYFGLKHLPLTIVGPINATRPVLTLVGAMVIFGETSMKSASEALNSRISLLRRPEIRLLTKRPFSSSGSFACATV